MSRTIQVGDCLIYTAGHSGRGGHTVISYEGRQQPVHRVAWMIAHGPIEAGLWVCHHCDVPRCVNVRHLFLGTVGDNNADRDRKGRQVAQAGELNGWAKLTAEQVVAIRERYAQGNTSQKVLGAEFGVTQSCIGRLVVGTTYPDVGGPLTVVGKGQYRSRPHEEGAAA